MKTFHSAICLGLLASLGLLESGFASGGGAPGTPDAFFTPQSNQMNSVTRMLAASDGSILLAGDFSSAGGTRSYLRRLQADGTVDSTFQGGPSGGAIMALTEQPDGRLLVGGGFELFGGQPRFGVARIDSEGRLDPAFVPYWAPQVDRVDVQALAVQADGRVLVGGCFDTGGGVNVGAVVRLNPDGSLDPTFQAPWGPHADWREDAMVFDVAVQRDGRILVAGRLPRQNHLVRLLPDGSVDPSFAVGGGAQGGYYPYTRQVLLLPDGRMVVAGNFSSFAGVACNQLVRLQPNGSVDSSFSAAAGCCIDSVALQPDGRLLVAGSFTNFNGAPRSALVLLNPNGSLDPRFELTSGYDQVLRVALQRDGQVLVLARHIYNYELNRLNGCVVPVLTNPAETIECLAGTQVRLRAPALGSPPLLWSWTRNGVPVIGSGSGETLVLAAAQSDDSGLYAVVVNGRFGSCTGAVCQLDVRTGAPLPPTVAVPPSPTGIAGGTVAFRAEVTGTGPFAYAWRRDGNPIPHGTNPVLRLERLQLADAGMYAVTVTGPGGAAQASAALTLVAPPQLVALPYASRVPPGADVVLGFTAGGTEPIRYSWQRNGETINEGDLPSLAFSAASAEEAGRYCVLASNAAGVVRSPPLPLTVQSPGAVDFGFDAGPLDRGVSTMFLMGDGRVVIGGPFVARHWTILDHMARLLPDGQLDPTFDTRCEVGNCCSTCYGAVLAVQADGRVIMTGSGSSFGRLTAEGQFDLSFEGPSLQSPRKALVQPDGGILVTYCDSEEGVAGHRLIRLKANGDLDWSFADAWLPGAGSCEYYYYYETDHCLALQPDGKILVSGGFHHVNELPAAGLVRLQTNGVPDPSFQPGLNLGEGQILALAAQPDGRILVGGDFESAHGVPNPGLMRLLADGQVDASFHAPWTNAAPVCAIALAPDGRIYVGLQQGSSDELPTHRIERLLPNGPLDPSFARPVTLDGAVTALALQPDGDLLASGWFTFVNEVERCGVVRFCGDGFNGFGDALGAPEWVWSTSVEHPWRIDVEESHDGHESALTPGTLSGQVAWLETTVTGPGVIRFFWKVESDPSHCCDELRFFIGGALRTNVTGTTGWREQRVTVPYGLQTLRWEYSTGRDDEGWPGAGWVDEVSFTPSAPAGPTVVAPLTPQRVWVGGDVLWRIQVEGTEPMMFYWRHGADAVAATDQPMLLLSSVDADRAGLWTVQVSNAWGSAFSAATLTVDAPRADWAWARRAGTDRGESAYVSLAVEPLGSVYLTGIFLDTMQMGTQLLTNAGSYDMFLAKYDATGRVVWGQRGGGVDWDSAEAVAVDPAGDVYVIGQCRGPAVFGTQAIGPTLNPQLYLVKYDPSGAVVRLRREGTASVSSGGTDLAVDGEGNVYQAAYVQNLNEPYYVATVDKLNASGTVLWHREFAVDYTPFDYRIAVDRSNRVVLAGSFWSHLSVGSLEATNVGRSSFFCVQLDAQGSPVWLRHAELQPNDQASVSSVSVDAAGNVLLCGQFSGAMVLGGVELVSRGEQDVFLAKYSAAGDLEWVQQVGGVRDDAAQAWCFPNGDIYLALRFQEMASIGDRVVVGERGRNACVMELAPNGEPRWLLRTGLPEYCRFSVAADSARRLYLAGSFTQAATFGTNTLSSTGWADMFLARLDVAQLLAPVVVTQPASRTRFAGQNVSFAVSAEGEKPLHYQWHFEGQALAGATAATLTMSNLGPANAGRYWVVVSNAGGSVSSDLATLSVLPAPTGLASVDFGFDLTASGQRIAMAGGPTDPERWGYPAAVHRIVVMPDGRVMIGGDFVGVNGVPRMNYARITGDGAVDGSFDSSWGTDGEISAVARQADGRWLVAGNFSLVNGVARQCVARLEADGRVDPTFHPTFQIMSSSRPIRDVVEQPDGTILVCGAFTNVNGLPRSWIVRLLPDGGVDSTFNPTVLPVGADGYVSGMVRQPDGRVLAYGDLRAVNAALVRLNPDGSQDTTFQPQSPDPGRVIVPSALALQADGKILMAYGYSYNLTRLLPNGRMDDTFRPPGRINGFVHAIQVQPDGRIVIGGTFGAVDDVARAGLARLNADGTLDLSFDPGDAVGIGGRVIGGPKVWALALQADGRILVGAETDHDRSPGNCFFRLNTDGARDPEFAVTLSPDHVAGWTMIPLADGKILVNGDFQTIGGVAQPFLARVNADGSVDASFQSEATSPFGLTLLAQQPDGRLLVGGWLDMPGGPNSLVRLDADGALDPGFQSVDANDGGQNFQAITAAALQPDGKIVIGGSFSAINGVARHYLARLEADGRLDESFVPASLAIGDDWYVTSVGVQHDGRVVVAGHIFDQPWSTYYGLARLHPDGAEDTGFRARVRVNGPVFRMLLQPDDKILFSGEFTQVNGQAITNLARLNPDGSLDSSFQPPAAHFLTVLAMAPDGKVFIADEHGTRRLRADGSVDAAWVCDAGGSVAVLPNGDVYLSGSFRSVNGVPIYGMARLRGDLEICPPVVHLSRSHQTRFAGQSVQLRADASGVGGLSYQWLYNGVAMAGATQPTLILNRVQPAQGGPYTVRVSSSAGSVTSAPFVLHVVAVPTGPGSIDLSFDLTGEGARTGLTGGEPGVFALTPQPDGKWIVGGRFVGIDGNPRARLARLRADGMLDGSFDPGLGADGYVGAAVVQSDGRVVISGAFRHVDGVERMHLARLDPDGRLDLGYQPRIEGAPGDDFAIFTLALQPDGCLLVAGTFERVDGVAQTGLARLLPNGSHDPTFHAGSPWAGPFPHIDTLEVLPDGAILVGADIVGGVFRLRADGALDADFSADLSSVGATARVGSIAVQPDGKLLVGGLFAYADGVPQENLARLHADGRLDPSFAVDFGSLSGSVFAIVLQEDGKAVVTGTFRTVNGEDRAGVVRLNPDGSVDPDYASEPVLGFSWPRVGVLALGSDGMAVIGLQLDERDPEGQALLKLNDWGGHCEEFSPRFDAVGGSNRRVAINAVVRQPDGRVLAGGWFTAVNGQDHTNLARFHPDGRWDREFVPDLGRNFYVNSVALQPDGKVVVGGTGVWYDEDGQSRDGLVRLHPNGAVDRSFAAPACDVVHAVAVQADGRVLVGGEFYHLGTPIIPGEEPAPGPSGIARLNADGTLDAAFAAPHIPAGDGFGVHAVLVQPDGKVLLGGMWPGISEANLPTALVRLLPDGTVDSNFVPDLGDYFTVHALALQPDGKILVGGIGHYVGADGVERHGIVRLNPDGTLDATFDPGEEFPDVVNAVAVAADGRILAALPGALFFNDTAMVRLNADGSRDASWQSDVRAPESLWDVLAIAVQPDGQVLVGGVFESVDGVPFAGLARLNGGSGQPGSFVVRDLTSPLYVPGGSTYEVLLYAQPPTGVQTYAVEDRPPSGWQVSDLTPGGVFDSQTGKVKFGPFYDGVRRTLGYHVTPTDGAVTAQCFDGTGSADGVDSPITGGHCMVPSVPHPADVTPPGWSLAVGEVTAYGAAWRRGAAWPAPPNPIPMDYATRAGFLWRGGECYEVTAAGTHAPMWWVNCALATPAAAPCPSLVERLSPRGYVPGEPLRVTVMVTPAPGAASYAVEESVPAGWTVSLIGDGGEFDASSSRVKWGPFVDATPRWLSCELRPPADAAGRATLAGVASFDGMSQPVSGPAVLVETCRLSLCPGTAQLQLAGRAGAHFRIEISTDLVHWTAAGTVELPSQGVLAFALPSQGESDSGCVFFRAAPVDSP